MEQQDKDNKQVCDWSLTDITNNPYNYNLAEIKKDYKPIIITEQHKMQKQTKKIQEIEKDEVFTIPGEDGTWCRRGLVRRALVNDTYIRYGAVNTTITDSKILEEDTVVIPTGEYFDIEPLVEKIQKEQIEMSQWKNRTQYGTTE